MNFTTRKSCKLMLQLRSKGQRWRSQGYLVRYQRV